MRWSRLLHRRRLVRHSAGRTIRLVRLRWTRHRRVVRCGAPRRISRRVVLRSGRGRAPVHIIGVASREVVVALRGPGHSATGWIPRCRGLCLLGTVGWSRYVMRPCAGIRCRNAVRRVRRIHVMLRWRSRIPSRHRRLVPVEASGACRRRHVGHDAAVRCRSWRDATGRGSVSAKNGLFSWRHIGTADKLSPTEC